MTREEIIELAEQAGFDPHDMSDDFTVNLENIETFARLVAEREREKCAKMCEQSKNIYGPLYETPSEYAYAIRARKEQK